MIPNALEWLAVNWLPVTVIIVTLILLYVFSRIRSRQENVLHQAPKLPLDTPRRPKKNPDRPRSEGGTGPEV